MTLEWIAVKNQLPKSGERVFFSWLNSHGNRRTSIGYYAGKLDILAEEAWDGFGELDSDFFEYHPDDVDGDNPYIPEGWYEEGAEAEYCYSQSGVTHWMPLPAPPHEPTTAGDEPMD